MLRQPGTQFGNLRLQRRHLRLQRQDRNAYGRRENLACGLQLGYYGHDRSPAAFPAPAYPTERLQFVNAVLPKNEHIGKALRTTQPLYPEIAVRELIANALVHQDFTLSGTGPTIEIFSDRIEITNPGVPLIRPDRFVDAPPQSRNEALASLMRRLGICEERGSGIDKVLTLVEAFQLPAPEFLVTDSHTRVVLYAPRPLSALGKEERIRATYWHAALLYASGGRKMTNTSLRERFKIPKTQHYVATRIISEALTANLIKPFDPDSVSRKHAKYVPYWA